MKLHNKFIIAGALAVCIFLGVCIGKILDFPGITFDTKISLSHFAQPLTTFIVAIFVTILFDRRKENSKNVKNILSGKLEDASSPLMNLYDLMELDVAIEVSKVHNKIKIARSRFAATLELCKTNNLTPLKSIEMLDKIKELNSLLTMIPAVQDDNPRDVAVESGNYIYSKNRKLDIQNAIERINSMCIEARIEILSM